MLPGRITTDKIVSGDGTSYFDMLANALKLGDMLQYNVNGDGRLKLRGTIVQSQSGDESPIGCFRGNFNALYTYYSGDETTYLVNGSYSTYRYINATPSAGHLPTETAYWAVVAQGQKGDKGQQGQKGLDGNNGKDGRNGVDGKNAYTFVRYSDDNGKTFTKPATSPAPDAAKGDNQFTYDQLYNSNVTGSSVSLFTEAERGELPLGTSVGYHVTAGGGNGGVFFYQDAAHRLLFGKTGTPLVLSCYMRAVGGAANVSIGIEGRALTPFNPLTKDWQRFEIKTTSDDQGHALLFYAYKACKFDLCCIQFAQGQGVDTWQPTPKDAAIGTTAGKYLGVASWDKNYPPLNLQMYQWSKATGENGKDADYQEYRFAKNGSTTTAPSLNKSVDAPTGWTLEQPVIGKMEYLWGTIAKKKANGTLLTSWSEPVRMTPYDGKNGKDGKDGVSPALVFCGVYDPSKTYYGNQYRIDACKYENAYYVCRVDAGEFKGVVPTNTAKWNSFGASFESIATNLLLAEGANIAGWIFRNNRLESQDGTIWLDGINGTMMANGGFTGALKAINLFMPFTHIRGEHVLQKTDPTNIQLYEYIDILVLPNDESYNGMFLNVYIPPRITRSMGGVVHGRILCPNKGIPDGLYMKEYYASDIGSRYGGVMQIVNINGIWVLLNGSNFLEYTQAQ